MLNLRHRLAFIILLLSLVACQTFTAPQTTTDKIMFAYATVSSSYRTIANLAQRKTITKDQGLLLIKRTDEAKAMVDVAKAALDKGDVSAAEATLTAASAILTEVESSLKDHGGGV
jgi:flagellin-specific chaperone FliS